MRNKLQPPHWVDKFLQWRLPQEQYEEVQGDMHELYGQWAEEIGETKAKLRYCWNALTFLRPLPKSPVASQNKYYQHSQTNSFDMISNHLTLTLRNLLRSKVQSFINIAGLALGIACCLMIFLVVRYELSYDNFHSKADRIYRVNTKFIAAGSFSGGAPLPMAQALKQEFPEIEEATTTDIAYERLFKVENQLFKQNGVVYVAPEYFSILDAEWLAGNPTTSLSDPNSVVLTKSVAQKFFGGTGHEIAEAALGKTITYDGNYTLKVTGILEDFPANTDLSFKVLISWITIKNHAPELDFNSWVAFSGSYTHFILLREDADVTQLQKKFPAFEKKYMGDVEASRRTHLLQPLREMHFDDRFGNYSGRVVTKENIAGLMLIGAFILLIACINFINLSTAQSVKRSKEIGVRKVLGANKLQLVRQFLSETSLLTVFSTLIAVGLTYLLAPQLKDLLNLSFTFNPLNDLVLLVFLLLITVVVSVLAGVYPALVLSGYQPILALKNKIIAPRSGALSLRRSLIVVQFAIAQVLIISTIVVSSQLEYFRSKPLGFNKDAIVTISFPAESKAETRRALRNQLEQIPGIQNVSYALFTPSSQSSWWNTFTFEGADPTREYYVQELPIDHTYLETYGLTLLAGKNLDETTDSSKILVNEKLLQAINIRKPENAIGQMLDWNGQNRQIAGVVKDFHTSSLKGEIPSVIMHRGKAIGMAGIKLEPANLRKTMAQVEALWKKTYPESLFEFTFLDETIANFYWEEVKLFKLFRVFSGIAIFISCLGLYGLVSFMAVQRTREIGIRKVLGASIPHIVVLFTKEFFVLILIAFAVAAPLAWYVMGTWLQNFQYSIPMGASSFIIAILFSLLIAGATVVYRSIRAALANPVQSLRSE